MRTTTTGILLWIKTFNVDIQMLIFSLVVSRRGSSIQWVTVEKHPEVGSGRQDTEGRN